MCTKDSVPKTMCQEQEQCAQGNVQEQEQCAQDNVPGARAVCPRQCTRRKNRKSKEENRTQAVVDIINLMFEQICKHTHLHTHKHAHTCSHSLTQTYTQTHLSYPSAGSEVLARPLPKQQRQRLQRFLLQLQVHQLRTGGNFGTDQISSTVFPFTEVAVKCAAAPSMIIPTHKARGLNIRNDTNATPKTLELLAKQLQQVQSNTLFTKQYIACIACRA